jgi:sterol desaturase/sphingolipid hydroxylase (fatty acid hydroxylase superfamily)
MTGAADTTTASGGEYVFYIPEGKWQTHFSSLLFSADVSATVMEVSLVGTLILVAAMFPDHVQTVNSMPLLELAVFMVFLSVLRRLYNS